MKVYAYHNECNIDITRGKICRDDCAVLDDGYIYIPYVIDLHNDTYSPDVINMVNLMYSARAFERERTPIDAQYMVAWIIRSPDDSYRLAVEFPRFVLDRIGVDMHMDNDTISIELDDSEKTMLLDIISDL